MKPPHTDDQIKSWCSRVSPRGLVVNFLALAVAVAFWWVLIPAAFFYYLAIEQRKMREPNLSAPPVE